MQVYSTLQAMKKLYFGTTNKGKLEEAKNILGIYIEGVSYDVDEVQSLDQSEVALKKAREYFRLHKKPIFIEDASVTISALGRLPGTLIDSFMSEIGNDGIIKILKGEKNRKATAEVSIVYIDKNNEKLFHGEIKGEIAIKPKGNKGFGWDPIFIPDNQNKTFGEMTLQEKNKYSMRRKALKKMSNWLKKNNI